ncbi:hypothetical protein ACJIZ3_011831 [Penstemon smallii]|uniref:LOB domain-containing protein n=1 Tax=Penstemon smallii TaxID=265156 RepID=A0ABD3UK88_9LAMI
MAAATTGTGSPCGACKFLRRKCAADCIFAPYFCSDQGPARFAAIHKVFGASNVSKLLLHVPVPDRCEAVVTIAYEAQARIRDPVYGCVSHIYTLQQQVAYLQAQVVQMKAQMAQNYLIEQSSKNQWTNNMAGGININIGSSSPIPNNFQNYMNNYSNISPQSSLDSCIDIVQRSRNDEIASFQLPYSCCKKRPSEIDLTELQALALRIMDINEN